MSNATRRGGAEILDLVGSSSSLSLPNTGRLRYDVTTQKFQASVNGGAFADVVIGVSLAIGAPITGATAGSVLFAGAAGILAQDNANFFWDDTNNRLGIGTASPSAQLDVRAPASPVVDHVQIYNTGGGGGDGRALLYFRSDVSTSRIWGIGIDSTGGTTKNFEWRDVTGGVVRMVLTTAGQLQLAALTTGSVLFAGASGAVSQDNATYFWDNTNKRLGIGTATPAAAIDINRSAASITGGFISRAGSFSAGFYSTGLFTSSPGGTFTVEDRNIHIQAAANVGGQKYQYITFNGRWSGDLNAPVLTQGQWGRASGIEFSEADTGLGPNPNTAINFFVNTGTKGTGAEFTVTPTRVMSLTYTARIGVGTVEPTHPLDIERIIGNTTAKFGPLGPIYMVSNNPNIGFNAYYNGGWLIGRSGGFTYGGSVGFDPPSGQMSFNVSTTTSSENGAVSMASRMTISQAGVVSIPALTTGSVPFIGASGAISQDNANFFWDDTNNRLGIGVAAPSFPLEVEGLLGNTPAKFGPDYPIALVSGTAFSVWPSVGFAAYYNGGWRFAEAAAGTYSAYMTFDNSTAVWSFYRSNQNFTGSGSLWGSPALHLTMGDGMFRVPYLGVFSPDSSWRGILLSSANGTFQVDIASDDLLWHSTTKRLCLGVNPGWAGATIEIRKAFSAQIHTRNTAAPSATSGSSMRVAVETNPSGANQRLGAFNFGSYLVDIITPTAGAAVEAFSEAAWTAGTSHPSYLSLKTTPSGGAAPLERVRITSTGELQVIGTSPNIFINGGTAPLLRFEAAGVQMPGFTTRSPGTRLVLYPFVSGTTVDFALGIDTGTLWSAIGEATSAYNFLWYAGITERMRLTGDGALQISASGAAVAVASTGRIRYNSTNQRFQVSSNAGGYFQIAEWSAAPFTGTVLFADGTDRIGQDSANFRWDNTNKRLGIGNAAPATALHVTGTVRASAGLTVDTMTAGSVWFAGASGALSQDNANLFWDDANNRLGIGTATPAAALHVTTGPRFDDVIDLSNIAAGSPNLNVVATSDTPAVTWGAAAGNEASAAPTGYLEIVVGGSPRYIPFWS